MIHPKQQSVFLEAYCASLLALSAEAIPSLGAQQFIPVQPAQPSSKAQRPSPVSYPRLDSISIDYPLPAPLESALEALTTAVAWCVDVTSITINATLPPELLLNLVLATHVAPSVRVLRYSGTFTPAHAPALRAALASPHLLVVDLSGAEVTDEGAALAECLVWTSAWAPRVPCLALGGVTLRDGRTLAGVLPRSTIQMLRIPGLRIPAAHVLELAEGITAAATGEVAVEAGAGAGAGAGPSPCPCAGVQPLLQALLGASKAISRAAGSSCAWPGRGQLQRVDVRGVGGLGDRLEKVPELVLM